MTRLTQMLAQFRSSFKHNEKFNYFPMHMARGLNRMQQTLVDVDCILEVHDARIPLSGRNPRFHENMMVRPRILLLNKVDLVEKKDWQGYEEVVREIDPSVRKVLCVSCKDQREAVVKEQILPSIMEVMKSSNRYHRKELDEYSVLVVGVPNVGKSSLINRLRNVLTRKGGKASAVGAKPGITRTVMERIKVSENPRVYILDTPGILPPSIPHPEVACKLALCATIPDTPFDLTHLVDFLLFSLNNLEQFTYVQRYGLERATDDVSELLMSVCKQQNLTIRLRSPNGGYVMKANVEQSASVVMRDFRKGVLGKVNLDKDLFTSPLPPMHQLQYL